MNIKQRICEKLTHHKYKKGIGYSVGVTPVEYHYRCRLCKKRSCNYTPYKGAPQRRKTIMRCKNCLTPTDQELCYDCWCYLHSHNPPLSERELIVKDVPLSHLRSLIEADRNGRCVVLPCRIGESLYHLHHDKIDKCVVEDIDIKFFTDDGVFDMSSIGEDVFLTCTKAERAQRDEYEM